jgi:hypothetical protein
MTTGTLTLILLIIWTFFAVITVTVPQGVVFHILDAVIIASGLMVLYVFMPGLVDAWRKRSNHIQAAHLLTLGIVSNWIGTVIRLARWYVTDADPSIFGPHCSLCKGVEEIGYAQWAYNIGMWISITAAFVLVGAVALTDLNWTGGRTLVTLGVFAMSLAFALFIDYAF